MCLSLGGFWEASAKKTNICKHEISRFMVFNNICHYSIIRVVLDFICVLLELLSYLT